MQIRQLTIANFRGIKHCEWKVAGSFVCLLGECNSTKSTLLDAIDFALSSKWALSFDDSDFHLCDSTKTILIQVTIGSLPPVLLTDAKFGRYCRGWNLATEELHDEPEEGDELVLTIQLLVDSSLEPKWTVVNDREAIGVTISARDREQLAVARVDSYVDRHLTWSRGSVLSRITEGNSEVSQMLAEITRTARQTIASNPPASLATAGKRVADAVEKLGVIQSGDYGARLDGKVMEIGSSGLTLHDGEIPVRLAGLGTRRLIALAIQRESAPGGAITLLDEIEHGLEPHKLRQLLRTLRDSVSSENGQIFFSTHSPVVIHELGAENLAIVRSQSGNTTITRIDGLELKTMLQKIPEALLSRKVVVCEGATEVGFCRGLSSWWVEAEGLSSLSSVGLALVDGEGSSGEARALQLRALGYDTALLLDADRELQNDLSMLEGEGIAVFRWDAGFAFETQLFKDLPWDAIKNLIGIAIAEKDVSVIRQTLIARTASLNDTLIQDPASVD